MLFSLIVIGIVFAIIEYSYGFFGVMTVIICILQLITVVILRAIILEIQAMRRGHE
jgi:hypothetical protein